MMAPHVFAIDANQDIDEYKVLLFAKSKRQTISDMIQFNVRLTTPDLMIRVACSIS
jgi:hypothetical protein